MEKKMILIIFLVLIGIISIIILWPQPVTQDGFKSEVLLENLNTPWAMDFLPGDIIIFTERGGKVKTWDGKSLKTVGNISVKEKGESG
ncbi:MAG: PQQ-dependent sugar dehydrogenase, partial [Methanobacteriaceae archaeon]|nr:PQQ-dependent sugar dehydrogenase [Methanobacteriaceae archaeon]